MVDLALLPSAASRPSSAEEAAYVRSGCPGTDHGRPPEARTARIGAVALARAQRPAPVLTSTKGEVLLSLNFQGEVGSRDRPVWVRKPVSRSGCRWMCLSRWTMVAFRPSRP